MKKDFDKKNYSRDYYVKKYETEKIKKSISGITLIALVITIIVILILAGVSIMTLTGENGLIQRAAKAKTETEDAAEYEKFRLAVQAAKIDGLGTVNAVVTNKNKYTEKHSKINNEIAMFFGKNLLFRTEI